MGFEPTGKTPEMVEATRRKIKRSGIRAVDQGTRYDISGNLRRLARAIDAGEHGVVANVVVGVGTRGLDGSFSVETFGFGMAGSVPDLAYTVARMAHRMQVAE